MTALKIILVIICAYLIGNINNALIISKIKGSDVRKKDSGNPGTMNMIRNFGKPLGAVTLVLDILKGVLPCLIGWFVLGKQYGFGEDKIGAYIAGLSVIVGHIFPVFLKFRGGKGIASSIGVCLVIHPIALLISFACGFIFLSITHMGAATSFLIISVPIILESYRAQLTDNLLGNALLFSLLMLTLFAHRTNIVKLFRGNENKTVLFKRKKKKEQANGLTKY